jgi:hypothetical protein
MFRHRVRHRVLFRAVLITLYPCDKIPDKINLNREIYFGSWFQRQDTTEGSAEQCKATHLMAARKHRKGEGARDKISPSRGWGHGSNGRTLA